MQPQLGLYCCILGLCTCWEYGEYSLSEVASSIPNDEYARYASACSSVSAENSFDIRMYDDYEVASYYHSPLSVPKSSNYRQCNAALTRVSGYLDRFSHIKNIQTLEVE